MMLNSVSQNVSVVSKFEFLFGASILQGLTLFSKILHCIIHLLTELNSLLKHYFAPPKELIGLSIAQSHVADLLGLYPMQSLKLLHFFYELLIRH